MKTHLRGAVEGWWRVDCDNSGGRRYAERFVGQTVMMIRSI